jgi:hypothetical protein
MADLGVDCGNPADDAMAADKPTLLIEVLSPTTGGFDVTVKLAEYQSFVAGIHPFHRHRDAERSFVFS